MADPFRLHPSAFILALADGTCLALCAGDETAARVVDFLARVATLTPSPLPLGEGPEVRDRRLLVVTAAGQDVILPHTGDATVVLSLEPTDTPRPHRLWKDPTARPEPLTEEQWFWQQLTRLSAAIARETLPRGGVLLHSGLATHPDLSGFGNLTGLCGVLLAGPSGVGKSTAGRRLPPPWRALADDVTLVVRDKEGAYWAHPWPTWSRFFGEEKGDGSDTWDVQRAAPLRAIFVLEQGEEDRIEPLGPGHAVALLAELARQTSTHFLHGWPLDELAAFNRQRFENLCALAQAVPAYALQVSRDGAFWTEIEQSLASC
jgi:SynChlorMet cassette protein ScmC